MYIYTQLGVPVLCAFAPLLNAGHKIQNVLKVAVQWSFIVGLPKNSENVAPGRLLRLIGRRQRGGVQGRRQTLHLHRKGAIYGGALNLVRPFCLGQGK